MTHGFDVADIVVVAVVVVGSVVVGAVSDCRDTNRNPTRWMWRPPLKRTPPSLKSTAIGRC